MNPERSSCPACGSDEHSPSWLGSGRFRAFHFEYRGCRSCGSLFVDPMPDDALVAQMYAPEYLRQHYDDGDASREIGRELTDTAAEAAQRKPGGRLLDVGCGAGSFLAAARAAGLRAEGYELLEESARVAAAATAAPVHSGSLASLPASYDVVHLADVLEHATDPLALLAAARDRLTKGGVIVARGPLEQQRNLFQLVVRWQRTARRRWRSAGELEMPPWHVSQLTLRGWHALLERAGLRILDERVYEVRWPAPDRVRIGAISIVKELSRAVSASPLGRRRQLGNRVVTWLAAN